MTRLGVCLVVLGALVGTARADKELDGAQVKNGFVVEVDLGTRFLTIDDGNGNTTALNSIQGGFFLGYKLSRVIFGMGLELQRAAVGANDGAGDNGTSAADTVIKVVPGIRVAILRSADKRVEMFGEFDLGLGGAVHEESPSPGTANPSTFALSYQVGPGVRYWIHPQFALSALAGVRGDFVFVSLPDNGGNTSTGFTSIFGQLGLMGVF